MLSNIKLPTNLNRFGFNHKGEPINMSEVRKIQDWILPNLDKATRINKKHTSYGIKHIIEKELGGYVANGDCIAAFILSGYKYEVSGPNAFFNIDQRVYNIYRDRNH